MKKIRLTESDLIRLIKKVIKENEDSYVSYKPTMKYFDGEFDIGNPNYERNMKLHKKRQEIEADDRKYNVPSYNSKGREWEKDELKNWVNKNYGVEVPDDLKPFTSHTIKKWLRDNEYSRLTESELIKIVKRVIKENEDFRSDMGVNPVFEDIMNEIEKMYEDITYANTIEELDMVERDIQYLLNDIHMSEDLSNDEKDELNDGLGDCMGLIDDMYSKFSEEDDYESWSGRSSDDDDDM